ncbi:MAG: cbb3-type cytochrome c oxidase subunit II [Chlamydiales bacterium]|nr:cbb3-type cytochrome c oxidase subunit II [Chlamydiales bacterium]
MKKLEWSAIWTVLAILVLFSFAVVITLLAPHHIDPSWQQASSVYQVQMYEVSDPNVYVSTSNPGGWGLQYVYHLQEGKTLQAYKESPIVRILASPELERYVTRLDDEKLKLTSRVLLLRTASSPEKQQKLREEWKEGEAPHFEILELYDPKKEEAFAVTESDGIVEDWTDKNFEVLDSVSYYTEKGTIYVHNPKEYRISRTYYRGHHYWLYDENGKPLTDLAELKEGDLRFLSRKNLIEMGENIYRAEGCWYCHTDQTRTLVQDVVLNGSADFPAPPSSANEYIYQKVTFPGTRRIGPDLSRVGIKRPHRDWHMSHFWSPTSESRGSIMPSFGHFFDNDPRGSFESPYGVPNYKFEAIFQYLMTKGTRITPPTEAWWLGKDPVQTIQIIDGR